VRLGATVAYAEGRPFDRLRNRSGTQYSPPTVALLPPLRHIVNWSAPRRRRDSPQPNTFLRKPRMKTETSVDATAETTLVKHTPYMQQYLRVTFLAL